MEAQEIKKRFTIYLVLILAVSSLFAIKGFWDNREGIHYSNRLKAVSAALEQGKPSKAKAELEKQLGDIQDRLGKHYRFPNLFFFLFVIINVILAVIDLTLLGKFPQGSSDQRRGSLRMIFALAASMITIVCFFLLEYHWVIRFSWAFVLLLIQFFLIGLSLALGISENVYDHLMGLKKDEDLIQGIPPPAW